MTKYLSVAVDWVVKGGGVKGQKMVQNEKKNSVCHAPYLRNHTYDFFMILMYKMVISLVVFFIFSRF